MKTLLKLLAVFLFSFLTISLVFPLIFSVLFAPGDPILASLPDHESKEFYSCNGFQDSTDYAKYTYRISESEFIHSPYFRRVTESDLLEITAYLDNFENWVEVCTDFPAESYDFDRSMITEDGYYYILNRYEEDEKKFWSYNIYYYQPSTGVLYYFHNNI